MGVMLLRRLHNRVRLLFGLLRSLGVDDWRVLGEAVATLLIVQAALRVVAFPRVLAWAVRVRRGNPGWAPQRVGRTAWLVGLAGRALGLRCLTRSLTVARVLGRRGIASDIRIGVQTGGGQLHAHAWVEWQGRVLLDSTSALEPFTQFDSP